MKKRIFALTLAVLMIISVASVSAAPSKHQPNSDKATYTVTYDGLTPGAMYGMLVLSGTDDEFAVSEDNILYIDQATADKDGKITFPAFALKGPAPTDDKFVESSVYIGGGNMTSAEWVGILEKLMEYIKGDINGDGSIDINDAVALFQHSLLPDVFPIDYTGLTDFNKDGALDLSDAVLLFQHSLLPDVFPLD